MAVLWLDSGGDHYATADISEVWDSTDQFPAVLSTSGRRSGGGLEVNTSDSVSKVFPAAQTIILGLAANFGGLPGVDARWIDFYGGGVLHVRLAVSGSGEIEINRSTTEIARTASGVVESGFHYYEFKITIADGTSGAVTIRKDGVQVFQNTSLDTRNAGSAAEISRIGLYGNNAFNPLIYDDIYIADTSGTAPQNDFLGDIQVDVIMPDAAGNSANFDTVQGSASHHLNVDETLPDHDTTYNETPTNADVDIFNYAALPAISGGSSVASVMVSALVKKTNAGLCNLTMVTRPVATNYRGADQQCGTEYKHRYEVWDKSPETSLVWTDTEINGSEFGIEKRA
jgi:hypothetical protein